VIEAKEIAEKVCPPWVARGGRTWELVIEAVQAAIDVTAQEIVRLKVIEAAHHRVVDALWYGERGVDDKLSTN
jgi:hypothetical protein